MAQQRRTLAQVNQPIGAQEKVLGTTCEKPTGASRLPIKLRETFSGGGRRSSLLSSQSN